MRFVITILSIVLVVGCAGLQRPDAEDAKLEQTVFECPGAVELPLDYANVFEPILDNTLLQSALGLPGEGKLCQGSVFQVKADALATLYRAWNSTNENSRFGQWWAFSQPEGKIANYRSDYEICYQWSPLDKMTQCTLKAGSKVVIGTGQSVRCSEYLNYSASSELQVFITDAESVSNSCQDFDGLFQWEPVVQN